MLAFMVKKLFGWVISPLGMFFGLLFFIVAARLWQGRWHAWHIVLGVGACFMLFLLSWPPTAYRLIASLESPFYDQFYEAQLPIEARVTNIDYVVVLGGGHNVHPHLPAVQQLQAETLYRLIEGIRLYQLYPQSTLIVSGGAGISTESVGALMYQAALELGVPAHRLVMETNTPDTQAQAAYFAKNYAASHLMVVTSAAHMMRTLMWFEHYGLTPTPAVTYFISHPDSQSTLAYWFPKASALYATQRALYEWFGIMHYHLSK